MKISGGLSNLAELIRFRLTAAVTLSAITGYFIHTTLAGIPLILLTAGIFLLAAGASALNQYNERDQDRMMLRTRKRPLPRGKIKPVTALVVSLLFIASGMVLLLFIRPITASLGMLNVLLYNLVYTRLKKITPLAVIPGAAVGAIPPLIGFTAAGGSMPQAEIILYSSFMFLWQLPHFWLILVKYRVDYQKAGFRTFSGKVSDKKIKALVFLWIVCTTSMLMLFGTTGLVFNPFLNAILIPGNVFFILLFYRQLFLQTDETALRKAYILVNLFGLLVMSLFIVNAFIR